MKRKPSKPRSVEQIIRIVRQADGDRTVGEDTFRREHNLIISHHQVHQETFYENSYLGRFGGHGRRRRF